MDGMVFQHDKPFIVKGTADSGATLTVRIGSQSVSTTAGADGTFRAEVPASPASLDPYELTIASGGKVVKDIKRVYSGDLFIAAGQSNMEASYDLYYKDDKDASVNMKDVITRSDLPSPSKDANIHYIKTDQQSSDSPTTDLPLRYSTDSWLDASSSPDKMSYTAYYTAAALRRKTPDVPVGVIDVSWGGTNISTQIKKIWNNHMDPLSGFNVGGVVWYQGESDSTYNVPAWMHEQFYLNNNGYDLPGLVDKFRTLAVDQKLPFVVVQLTRSDLANFFYSPIRDAQSKAVMGKSNMALVSTLDTDKGTSELIHPMGKDIVGTRAGEALSSMIAGTTPAQGPIPSQATVNGSTVTVTFKWDTGKGLKAMSPIYDRTATSDHYATADSSGNIDEVEVAGSDGVFQPAKAKVSGDTLVVTAQGINGSPTQVRYAWDNQPAHPNLYNGKNLPAGTFVIDVDGATVNAKPRSVLFNDNGGGSTVTPVSGDAGAQAKIPTKIPTRPKYTFKEWNTQANGSGTAYHPGDAFTIPDRNLTTLYAIWETSPTTPTTTHTVTFDANGGSATAKQTVKDGGKATKPADPTRNGYTFAGWTLNGKAYDFGQSVTGDITLVAQWETSPTTPTATDACTPYSRSEGVCPTGTLPSHYLDDEDIPDAYKGFTFSTEKYPFDNAVWDDGDWTDNGIYRIPTKDGASVRLPKVGSWTDPQGVKHDIDATITVIDRNGGQAFNYHGSFGLFTSFTGADLKLRYGATWKVTFTYSDTGETVPDTFKGITGFGDLDGTDSKGVKASEGVELLDGFDSAYTVKNAHLAKYGTNGWAGAVDNNLDQTDMSSEHAQQHILDATFSGPSITFRYTSLLTNYGTVFNAPLTQAQLFPSVFGKAIDRDGKVLKEWTVAEKLHSGDAYKATHPDIDGYRYDGLADDSAPESGTVTDASPTVTYRYVKQCTVTWKDGLTGDIISSKTLDCGVAMPQNPAAPSHDGYQPGVWDRSGGTLDKDTTITAGYEKKTIHLTYDGNGSTSGHVDGVETGIGERVTVAPNGFARTGYAFTGWNTKADGSGTAYRPGDAIEPVSDSVLYAQWRATQSTLPFTGQSLQWWQWLFLIGFPFALVALSVILWRRSREYDAWDC